MGTIYRITNKINGKKYIGQTVTSGVKDRYRNFNKLSESYLKDSTRPIDRAFVKYGIAGFIIEDIEENVPDEKLNERERWWIKDQNSLVPFGYNMDSGGSSGQRQCLAFKNLKKELFTKKQNWLNREYGMFYGSRTELSQKYPEQKLNISKLSQVSSGKRKQYKGWILPKNKDLDMTDEGVFVWYNQKFGIYHGKIHELCKKYPEQKLHDCILQKVTKEKCDHHKGWCLENKHPEGFFYTPNKHTSGEIVTTLPGGISRKEKIRLFNYNTHTYENLTLEEYKQKYKMRSWFRLVKVIEGGRPSYLGLVLPKNAEKYKELTWVHPIHGKIQATPKNLILKYPYLERGSTCIYSIYNGKKNYKSYKGWKIEKLTKKE